MPEAVSVSVADAVVAQIQAATLSQTSYTIERSYADWEMELEDEGDLRVDVVPVMTAEAIDLESRGTNRFTIPIDIAVRKKFAAGERSDDTGRPLLTAVDGLILFTQEIHELFQPQRLADFDDAVWESCSIVAAPDKGALHKQKQFVGIVRVVFRVEKAIA